MSKKERLDTLLVNREFYSNRQSAKSNILVGNVIVNGTVVTKAGHAVSVDAEIRVKEPDHPYVSRGGIKLAHALDHFNIDPTGMTCLDIGASTGGFTDCLLQKGAAKVWAIDVGTNQLDYKLRSDDRVVCHEGVNARDADLLSLVTDKIDLLVADVSFISLTLAIPPALPLLKDGAVAILLVKPQFEVGRGNVGKGGLVTDEKAQQEAVDNVVSFFKNHGLESLGVTESPIKGAKKGNVEFLAGFQKERNSFLF